MRSLIGRSGAALKNFLHFSLTFNAGDELTKSNDDSYHCDCPFDRERERIDITRKTNKVAQNVVTIRPIITGVENPPMMRRFADEATLSLDSMSKTAPVNIDANVAFGNE